MHNFSVSIFLAKICNYIWNWILNDLSAKCKLCSYRQKHWWRIVLISHILCMYKHLLIFNDFILATEHSCPTAFFLPWVYLVVSVKVRAIYISDLPKKKPKQKTTKKKRKASCGCSIPEQDVCNYSICYDYKPISINSTK